MKISTPRIALVLTAFAAGFAIPASAEDLAAAIASAELGRRYDEPLLKKAATHASPSTRAAAARAAGRIRNADAIAWLLPMVKDNAGRVRRAALFALGQIGTAEIVIPLRESLARLEENDLAVALEALGKTKDPRAAAAITARLTHRTAVVRGAAALALFRLGDPSTVPELVGALRSEKDPEARWREVYAISRLLRGQAGKKKALVPGDDAWVGPLRLATGEDRPFFERCFGARALGALEGQEAFLLQLAGSSDPRVVVAALRGLGTSPEPRSASTVANFSGHKNDLVRETAVAALQRWGKDVVPEWKRILPGLTGRLRMTALLALAEAGDVRPAKGQFRRDADAAALEEEYAWRLLPFLADEAPHPDPKSLKSVAAMRAAATSCTQEGVGRERAETILRHLLTIEDFTVQTMAVGTLAELGIKSAAPEIVAAARKATKPTWVDVRTEAASALATLGVYDPWLDEAATDADRFVRDAARAALEKLKRPLPPKRPLGGFQLAGQDAGKVLAAARELVGARVRLKTTRGTMVMVLLPDEAPTHCVNLARLVAKGFYDGRVWHRVVPDFVIQGGCPRGDGWGGPGYAIPDEIGTRPYVRGTVGMPKAGDDTGGCQIFINHLPTPHLDGRYTVFAQVIEGLDVIDRIRVGDKMVKATLEVREPSK